MTDFVGDSSNNTFNVPAGFHTVDGRAGIDLLVCDLSALATAVSMNMSDPVPASGNILITGGVDGSISFTSVERFDITGGTAADVLRDGQLSDTLRGGNGDDLIVTSLAADTVIGGGGIDRWQGNLGDFTLDLSLVLSSAPINLANGTSISGIDQVTLFSGSGNDALTGGTRADEFHGGDGTDQLTGGGGSDQLFGDSGDDTLTDGSNNAFDTVDGGTGSDLLIVNLTGVGSDAAMNVSDAVPGSGNLLIAGGVNGSVSFTSVERFQIAGGNGDDTLRDGLLGDTLNGGAGDDTIHSSASADTLDGGSGSDRWVGDLGEFNGAVTLTLTAGAIALANGTTLNGFEAATVSTGNGDDTLTGAALGDVFGGGGGNDTLAGGAGSNALSGDTGNDTLIAGSLGGFDTADGGFGTDTLVADFTGLGVALAMSVSDATPATGNILLSGGVDGSISFTSVEIFEVTGGSAADTLRDGRMGDTLNGGGGDDLIVTSLNGDTVIGGSGIDRWQGNLGDYTGTLNLALTTATIALANGTSIAGIDAVTLFSGRGNDTLTGNTRDDEFHGGAGNDTVNGGTGSDSVFGDGGNDIVTAGNFNGFDTVDGGAGSDLLIASFTGVSADLSMSVSDAVPASGNILIAGGVSGSVSFSRIERFQVTGGSGGDTLRDGRLADTLDGGSGDDTLFSTLGTDTVVGGSGIDRWNGNLSGFSGAVTLALNAGLINLANGGSIAGIEAVTLTTGNGADTLTGNVRDDEFHGGAGADTINGGVGSDTIFGDGGNDTLAAGNLNGFDTVNGGAGRDLLIANLSAIGSAVVMSLSDPVPATGNILINGGVSGSVSFTSVERFQVTGGTNNDTLLGGQLDDTLSGGNGNDNLNGGGGNDTLTGAAGNDRYLFGFDWGDDTIVGFTDVADRINLSATDLVFADLVITQAGADALISVIGTGDTITVDNFNAANLTGSDFIF